MFGNLGCAGQNVYQAGRRSDQRCTGSLQQNSQEALSACPYQPRGLLRLVEVFRNALLCEGLDGVCPIRLVSHRGLI